MYEVQIDVEVSRVGKWNIIVPDAIEFKSDKYEEYINELISQLHIDDLIIDEWKDELDFTGERIIE